VDTTDNFERGLRRGNRRSVVALAVIGLAAVGVVVYLVERDVAHTRDWHDKQSAERARRDQQLREGADTAEGKQALAHRLDAAVERAHQLDVAFRAGVTAALTAASAPGASGGTCPVGREATWFAELEPGEAVRDSRLASAVATYATQAREALAAGINPFTKYGEPFDVEAKDRYQVVLGMTRHVAPSRVGKLFVAGEIDGRAVLWDHARGAVVCATEVHARNSSEVSSSAVVYSNATANVVNGVAGTDVDPSARDGALIDDLDKQVQNAIWVAPAMHAVGDATADDPAAP